MLGKQKKGACLGERGFFEGCLAKLQKKNRKRRREYEYSTKMKKYAKNRKNPLDKRESK